MIQNLKNRKVLVIGLDMGDGELVQRWATQGYLPRLKERIENGKWAELSTTAEVLHVSAWPSLYTGTLPGKHGVYYTYQPARGRQLAERIGKGQYGCPPIWKILDQSGKKCVVMDAPYTFPEEGYKGKQIFEWGTWAWYWHPMAVPDGLWREFKSVCNDYPLGYEANQIGLGTVNLQELRDRLLRSAASKAKAVKWLMEKDEWDFAWIVFGETHPAAHYLWNDDNIESNVDSYCRDVYQAVDEAIGRILDSMENDVMVFIVSGDGVGKNQAGWHLLPDILIKTGYLVEPGISKTNTDGESAKSSTRKDILKQLRGLIPDNFRQMISRKLPSSLRDKLMSRWAKAGVDWGRTRAYCLPTDLEGCIRINLKNREPEGIVEPGREYKEVCREIEKILYSLTKRETGKKAVKAVHLIDEVYSGDKRDDLPDIVVSWADESEFNEINVPGFGDVSGVSPDARNGTHRPSGFVIASGAGATGGHLRGRYNVIDFAPTLLSLIGISVPSYMDGRIWEDIL